MLAYANFSLPFILEVDACQYRLGAVLSQEQEGKVRPLAYASRTLNRTEKRMPNYSSMKLVSCSEIGNGGEILRIFARP